MLGDRGETKRALYLLWYLLKWGAREAGKGGGGGYCHEIKYITTPFHLTSEIGRLEMHKSKTELVYQSVDLAAGNITNMGNSSVNQQIILEVITHSPIALIIVSC